MHQTKHPWMLLKEQLEKRGWSQSDLTYVLGCSAKTVNQIINAKQGISPAMSKALGEVFGLGQDYFADLQLEFELAKAEEPDPSIGLRARMRQNYPVRDMIKRGWIPEEPELLGNKFAEFFGVESPDSAPHISHAAKKGDYMTAIPAAQLAWLFRVRQVAQSISVPKYSKKKLLDAIEQMKHFLLSPEETRHVPRLMMECGVRFVIVETLPGSKIDGVCFWLSSSQPVIGMSMRRDQMDNFWFVLRHEIEHVLQGHGKASEFGQIDVELHGNNASVGKDALPEEEEIANLAASDFCVPKTKMDSFLKRKNPFFYEKDVVAFSKLNNIHPALPIGQIQRATDRYDYLKKYQVKVRSFILPSAIVDGFGQSA